MAVTGNSPRIGYFGKEGSNTEYAAKEMYRGEFRGFSSIQSVFQAVKSGDIDYGVVPIENSVEGSVGITNDLLYRDEVYIVGELYSKITHCLIVRPGTGLESVKNVISHPQALGQCSEYIFKMGLNTMPFPDTASAVASLAEVRYSSYAAIGSERTAALYGMEVLARDIGDFPDNHTRFVSISRTVAKRSAEGIQLKASIVVSLDHRPGSLNGILEIFSRNGINLTRIESRPVKFSPWRYIFFLDAIYRNEYETVFAEIREKSSTYKLLGIYPAAVL